MLFPVDSQELEFSHMSSIVKWAKKISHLKFLSYLMVLGFLAGTLVLVPQAEAKEEGDLIVRLRSVAFLPDVDGTTDTLGGSAAVSDAASPELDFTYFFTDNIAAELILSTFSHNVKVSGSSAGDLDLGDVWLLPPVLTLQYHFMPKETFSPYIGAGINYTITYNADPGTSVTSIDYSDELGYAFQAGFDYALDDVWSLNFDVKKVFVETDITTNATNAPNTELDPLAISIGLGYKF